MKRIDKLGHLEPVDLREYWPDEAVDFTPWLTEEENLSVLADTLNMELEFEAQEKDVGRFHADILCKNTEDGSWVLIENQLERTDHTHLGQLLTYAAGLQAVTICWISKHFTDEHRAALDWLNEITDDRFQFFGLEIELWQIGGPPAAPKFNIVSKPNDWTRSVSQASRNIASDRGVSPLKLQQQQFWTELREYLSEQQSPIRMGKPQPQHWMYFGIGQSGFKLSTTLNSREKFIGVELLLEPPNAKKHFWLLKEQQADIGDQIGELLEWLELPGRKSSRIVAFNRNADPTNQNGWPDQIEWMASMLKIFYETFHQRVKDLDASDWRPDDEPDE